MLEYRLVTGSTTTIQERLNQLLKVGWTPLGSTFRTGNSINLHPSASIPTTAEIGQAVIKDAPTPEGPKADCYSECPETVAVDPLPQEQRRRR